jgi:hypothetical protein
MLPLAPAFEEAPGERYQVVDVKSLRQSEENQAGGTRLLLWWEVQVLGDDDTLFLRG